MTDFGVTDAGFIPKTQQDIITDFETRQRATIDSLLDVSSEQPIGQLNGIYGRALAELYEIAVVAFDSYDPDRAEGVRLVSVCKISGTEKNGATFSTVIVDVDLDIGTELVSGTHFVQITGNPSVRFTPIASITAGFTGTFSVPFRAETAGPIVAVAHSLTTITTPVVGWTHADNASDATVGLPADNDSTLRARREKALQATGSATVGAIRSDVLELVDTDGIQFVQSCTVFENVGDTVDATGLPPHSFEVLVYDGTPTSPHSDLIAQAIWDDRADGIRAFGSTSGNAVDELGGSHVVAFSRATSVPIYVSFTLSTGTGYVGAASVKALVAAFANAKFNQPGMDVTALYVEALALGAGGVIDVTAFAIGRSPSPSSATNIVIGVRELARFDTTNITVT